MKFHLTINSHSLSNFQSCETKYGLSEILQIESPEQNKVAMDKGTEFARLLQLYYYGKIRARRGQKDFIFNPLPLMQRWERKFGTGKHVMDLIKAFHMYKETYKDETWIPIAAESGFTKKLYEDEHNVFFYEGRPDLIIKDGTSIYPVDHKTQAQYRNYYGFSNQPLGYVWAGDFKQFVYNYIVFKTEPDFRRQVIIYSTEQLQQWVNSTTEWCFKIKHAYERKHFGLNNNSCQTPFGICQYSKVCEAPTPSMKDWVIKRDYTKKKKRRSW